MIEISVASDGLNSSHDLTEEITQALRDGGAGDGLAGVFAHGSTLGLVIMRYEPGAMQDLLRALERAAPDDARYLHELTTGDPNGFSHVRSSLLGTSVLVPYRAGKLDMSAAHRIVLIDFDLKPANRRVLIDPPRPISEKG
ncbi:YjbQ family protein [Streptosporangium sp. NPDC051022]|uniref:YjbQ family protein n=1 Tax=Streptosporangium sp. NPDC051022 TaxID=3155752 RepID=UPI003416D2F2